MGPCDFANPHDKPHHEHDKGEGIDALVTPWVNAWVAYLLTVQ